MFQPPSPRLILASASRTRRALLDAAGLVFEARAADVDEASLKAQVRSAGGSAAEAALALAHAKAAALNPPADAIVIGADQILVRGDAWFDKPADMQAARAQLLALRGAPHILVTAVVCHTGGAPVWQHVATPRLTMRAFSEAFVDAYLAAEGDAVLGSVGVYRLEGRGMHLFDAIEGEHSAVLGLPMVALLGFLRGCGMVMA
jgi:septum formation protein